MITVVGESLVDVVARRSRDELTVHPGGSPANVAVALSRLGQRTALVTQIGADDYGALVPRVLSDLACRFFECALHDIQADGFIVVMELELFQGRQAAQKSNTTAGNNTLLNCRTSGMHGVFHTSLLFFQLRLSRRSHLDHRNATNQLG